MIKIIRVDKMSINLQCDLEGVIELKQLFKDISNKMSEKSIVVTFDSSIINMKKASLIQELIIIRNVGETITRFISVDDKVIWEIEREDIEYIIERLKLCLEDGYFSPAELVRCKVSKNKYLDYIYCELQK